MRPKDADGMANSVYPDQIAPGSALFAQTCLSKNLGPVRWLQVTRPQRTPHILILAAYLGCLLHDQSNKKKQTNKTPEVVAFLG